MQSLKERQEQDDKYNPAEGRYGAHDDLGVHPERREAEADDLEKLYNAESRTDEDRNTISKPSTDEQSALSDRETTLGDSQKEKGTKSKKLKITKRQAAAGGGAAGLLIGGGVGFFVFMSGPLQFIQFAQLLQRFHFSNSERFGNTRTSKLFRYASRKITGRGPHNQDYNMSRLGNKVALHYEKKLSKKGIQLDYDGRTGRLNKIILDPNTSAGKKMIADIESKHGVSMPKNSDGRVHLDFAMDSSEISSARVRRQNIGASVEVIGMNRVSSALSKRMLKIRAGVNFHPLRNLARNFDEKANLKFREWRDKIKNDRAEKIKKGSQPPDNIKTSSGKEDPNKPSSEADKAKTGELDGKINDAQKIAQDTSVDIKTRASKIKATLGAGVGATAILGIVCGVDAIGDSIAETQEQNIIQPLIRTGMDVVTTGNQIMSGQNTNMDELGALSENLYDKTNHTSWMSAESIQSELGRPGVGVKMDDATKPGKDRPVFFETINTVTSIPGISQTCSAMNSTIGSFLLSAGSIIATFSGAGGVILNVGGEAIQYLAAGAFMDDLVRILAGSAPEIAKATGGTLGNYANYGAFLANNNAMAGMGGRSLKMSERLSLAEETRAEVFEKNKQKSLYARLFDIKDIDSLISRSVIQNNHLYDTQTAFASIIKSPFSFLGTIGSSVTKLNPRINAQTTLYDYGVDEIGFSIGERDSALVEDPYANADIVEPQLAELNEKYGKVCFGTTIEPSTGKITYEKAPSYSDREKNKSVCGSDNKDEMFLRYRMFVADNITINSIACYESIDENSCKEIRLETGSSSSDSSATTATTTANAQIVGNPEESSVSVACAPGTNDVGIHTGYVDGNPVEHRLCALPNFPSTSSESNPGTQYYVEGANGSALVNSRVSGAWFTLISDMIKTGITPSANSSFRTMKHQQDIYNGTADKKAVASPGNSPHQGGQAIDFALGSGGKGSGSSTDCSSRQRADGNAVWEWLFSNAENYGFKQYSYEAWHWDAKDMANRCNSSQP